MLSIPGRKSYKYLPTAVAIVSLGTACAGTTSRSVSYLGRPLAPLPDTVAINTWPVGILPERPYGIVGEVYVQRAAATVMSHVDRQELLDELRTEARKMGADGIVSMLSGSTGVTWREVDQAWFWGIAVRFTDAWADREGTEERRRQLEEQARQRFAERRT